ncbi:hypothetical protein ACHAWC_005737 [Mediolabrus comicus]
MIGSTLARAARPVAARQQRRGIVNWMTNYPDKVMEIKKVQMKGGTCQGEYNPTWLKQEGDTLTLAFGAILVAWGTVSCSVGMYRLATGKGKKD